MTCPACTSLAAVNVQCNFHARTDPNTATLTRRELARMVREEGISPAEAEARMGVTRGATVN